MSKAHTEGNQKPLILVVDDEPHFLALMTLALSKEGYQVVTASAGVDALVEVDTRQFSVAILDIRMHPLSGIELLTAINVRQPSINVIMTTGYPTEEIKNECLNRGARYFLDKPLDMGDLKSKIRGLVNDWTTNHTS